MPKGLSNYQFKRLHYEMFYLDSLVEDLRKEKERIAFKLDPINWDLLLARAEARQMEIQRVFEILKINY